MSRSPVDELDVQVVRVRTSGRWTTYEDVVAALRTRWLRGEFLPGPVPWRPLVVPLRAPSATEIAADFAGASSWVDDWRGRSGRFVLAWSTVGGRRFGVNDVPRRLRVDSQAALWSLLGVTPQAERYHELAGATRATLPELTAWVAGNSMKVLANESIWQQLVAVAEWLRDVAQPGIPLRQIDVPGVDTKFVERHRGLLAELLDICLPAERIDTEHPRHAFERRYRLSTKPTYLRLRRLDGASLYPQLPGAQELSLRIDELADVPVPCRTVFVVENEVSYIAFPPVPDAVAVFGSGFAVSLLAGISWLSERDLVYWGDIDSHGFVMLDRLRATFPRVRSILMDRETFLDHETHWGREPVQTNTQLLNLTADEARLYEDLLEATFGPALRLEQERISFRAVLDSLKRF